MDICVGETMSVFENDEGTQCIESNAFCYEELLPFLSCLQQFCLTLLAGVSKLKHSYVAEL